MNSTLFKKPTTTVVKNSPIDTLFFRPVNTENELTINLSNENLTTFESLFGGQLIVTSTVTIHPWFGQKTLLHVRNGGELCFQCILPPALAGQKGVLDVTKGYIEGSGGEFYVLILFEGGVVKLELTMEGWYDTDVPARVYYFCENGVSFTKLPKYRSRPTSFAVCGDTLFIATGHEWNLNIYIASMSCFDEENKLIELKFLYTPKRYGNEKDLPFTINNSDITFRNVGGKLQTVKFLSKEQEPFLCITKDQYNLSTVRDLEGKTALTIGMHQVERRRGEIVINRGSHLTIYKISKGEKPDIVIDTGIKKTPVQHQLDGISCICATPGSTDYIATGSQSGIFTIWNIEKSKPEFSIDFAKSTGMMRGMNTNITKISPLIKGRWVVVFETGKICTFQGPDFSKCS